MLSRVLAILASALAVASALPSAATGVLFQLPDGAADGLYTARLLDNGTTEWTYHGANPTDRAKNGRRWIVDTVFRSSPLSGLTKRSDIGPHCNDFELSSLTDIQNAQGLLEAEFGNGLSFCEDTIGIVSGSVVAFGCNYNGGCSAPQTAGGYASDLADVNAVCGDLTAGWFSHSDNRNSFGRTAYPMYYC
jgi:hypothetical protein